MSFSQPPAPGSRALIRDEEWLVQHADQCAQGGWQLSCIGVSETVRNRHALFLKALNDVTACSTMAIADSQLPFMRGGWA